MVAKDEVVADKSLSVPVVDNAKAGFELDMIAYYKELNNEIMGLIEEGFNNKLSPDEIVESIEELFNE